MTNTLRDRILQFLTRNSAGVLLNMTESGHRKSDHDIICEWWERELALLLASEIYQLALLALNHTIFTRIVILEWTHGERTCALSVTAQGLSYEGCAQRTSSDSLLATANSIAYDMLPSPPSVLLPFEKRFANARTLLEESLIREMIAHDIARDAARFAPHP